MGVVYNYCATPHLTNQITMEVEQNVVNIVDPQAGVVQQRRDVLVRAPRRDGGVDVLLARTVKTVRLVSEGAISTSMKQINSMFSIHWL